MDSLFSEKKGGTTLLLVVLIMRLGDPRWTWHVVALLD